MEVGQDLFGIAAHLGRNGAALGCCYSGVTECCSRCCSGLLSKTEHEIQRMSLNPNVSYCLYSSGLYTMFSILCLLDVCVLKKFCACSCDPNLRGISLFLDPAPAFSWMTFRYI